MSKKVSAFDHSLAKITGGEGGGAEEKYGWSPTHELALAMIKKKVKNNNENKLEIR